MQNKIVTIYQAKEVLSSKNLTLVTGSFDFVHLGHLRFIHQAKSYKKNNKLLLILLSDESIKTRKGDGRPIFNEQERVEFASHLEDVDYVLLWNKPWEDLRQFFVEIKPNVYVVNSDDPGMENKMEICKKINCEFIVLKRKDDFSTSKIISRIKGL